MGDLYGSNDDSRFLQYLDANNLYGWAMAQKLPTHGFTWIKDVEEFTAENISKLADKCYILEVDASYPKELHNEHNELPFLPERTKIEGVEKLLPNLNNKKNYVVHIRTLDQALKHGPILDKAHKVIHFEQSEWLKSYIMLNTELRTAAKNEFEKDFFKLMNNSVFGKTMENIRNHRDTRLVTIEKNYKKYVMQPNFKDGVKFSEHLLGMKMGKTEIKMKNQYTLNKRYWILVKL